MQNVASDHWINSPLCRPSYFFSQDAAGDGELRRLGNFRHERLQLSRTCANSAESEYSACAGEPMRNASDFLLEPRSRRPVLQLSGESFQHHAVRLRAISKALAKRRQPILDSVGHAAIFLRISAARVMGLNGLVMTPQAPSAVNCTISLD